MYQNDIVFFGATRVSIGLSAVIKITAPESCVAGFFKKLSGNTLEIVGHTAGTSAWTNGYRVGETECVNWVGPASFYLVATGATVVVGLVIGKNAGATTL